MNILEHPIHKDIYDLCQEIEQLPASELATKVVIMASDLHKPASELVADNRRLREVVKWVASQQNLFFAECSQAEEIVARCRQALAPPPNTPAVALSEGLGDEQRLDLAWMSLERLESGYRALYEEMKAWRKEAKSTRSERVPDRVSVVMWHERGGLNRTGILAVHADRLTADLEAKQWNARGTTTFYDVTDWQVMPAAPNVKS